MKDITIIFKINSKRLTANTFFKTLKSSTNTLYINAIIPIGISLNDKSNTESKVKYSKGLTKTPFLNMEELLL